MSRSWLSVWALLVAGCGGAEPPPPAPVPHVTPREQITQLSRHWLATDETRLLLAPPSPISVQVTRSQSRIDLGGPSGPNEELILERRFDMSDGSVTLCRLSLRAPLTATYAWRKGEPSVALHRQELAAPWQCAPTVPPGLPDQIAASVVLLVLRDDQLAVVEPPADRRQYLPVD